MKDLPGAVVSITSQAATMSGGSIESDCAADGSGGGVQHKHAVRQRRRNCWGCDERYAAKSITTGTITGSGGTRFSGKVTNNKGDYDDKSTIESGTFTGEGDQRLRA